MTRSLKHRLLKFLQRHGGWVASGELQRIALERAGRSPQNAGRRLRELAEDGKLDVKYIKNHAYYRAKKRLVKVPYTLDDGTVIHREEYETKAI